MTSTIDITENHFRPMIFILDVVALILTIQLRFSIRQDLAFGYEKKNGNKPHFYNSFSTFKFSIFFKHFNWLQRLWNGSVFLRQLLALLKKICRFSKMYVFVEVETSFIRFSYNLIFNILKDKIFRHIFLLFE